MPPFERQVNFGISSDDFPLLEAAREEHGTIKAGIHAGLRLLAQGRLDRAGPHVVPSPELPPSPSPSPLSPPPADASDWWMSVAVVAETFGRSPATVRKWVADGRASARGDGRDLEIDIATVQLERSAAAEWLGVKSATLKRWTTTDGRAKATAGGLYLFGDLELPVSRASHRWNFSRSELASLEKRSRETPHGPMVRILDAVELAGSETVSPEAGS
jgi:hypothetical protein